MTENTEIMYQVLENLDKGNLFTDDGMVGLNGGPKKTIRNLNQIIYHKTVLQTKVKRNG